MSGISVEKWCWVGTSGDVEVSDIIGPVKASSTSGDLELNKIEGRIEARSTSGNVDVANTQSQIMVQSTSGEIVLNSVTGQYSVRATSGDIEGSDVELNGDSEFKTSSGDIDIELVNDVESLSFDLQASSGSLYVNERKSDRSIYIKRGGYWVKGISSSGSQRYEN